MCFSLLYFFTSLVFFKGARHTYAQMAGRNVANPTAMLLSGADMLDHIKYVTECIYSIQILRACLNEGLTSLPIMFSCSLKVHARTVRTAVERTISTGKVSIQGTNYAAKTASQKILPANR